MEARITSLEPQFATETSRPTGGDFGGSPCAFGFTLRSEALHHPANDRRGKLVGHRFAGGGHAPRTGEEARSLLQLKPSIAVVVTAPQLISESAVRKVVVMAAEYRMSIWALWKTDKRALPEKPTTGWRRITVCPC